MAQDPELDRPQEVTDRAGDGGLGVHHRDVDVARRRADAVGADEVDLDLAVGTAEVAQDRHREVHGEGRRHLHAQRAQGRCGRALDLIERVFEAVEGLRDRGQEVLAGLGQHEGVRTALEELHADQFLERDHVARQRALGNQERIRCARETAVLGDRFKRPQGVEWQPAPVDPHLVHRPLPRHAGGGGPAVILLRAPRRRGAPLGDLQRCERAATEPARPMPFSGAPIQFLGFYGLPIYESLPCGRIAVASGTAGPGRTQGQE